MASNDRTKLGIAMGVAVLAGLTSVLFSVLLLALAGFLVVWGREPRRTEEFVGGLPFGLRALRDRRALRGHCDARSSKARANHAG